MSQSRIIKQPLVTEKGTYLSSLDKYIFEVESRSTKSEVKKAVEHRFKVHVVSVNIINLSGKPKRYRGLNRQTSGRKKAVVTIKVGEKINI